MKQAQTILTLSPSGRGLFDFTHEVNRWLAATGIATGLLTLFVRHTSCSLTIQENADTDVRRDLLDFYARLAPDGDPRYRHSEEGPDDMSAHIRTTLTDLSLAIPVGGGRLLLGTWQGFYLFEHRSGSQRRQVVLHLIGE